MSTWTELALTGRLKNKYYPFLMNARSTFRDLRDILAELYDDGFSAKRVAHDAGLNTSTIRFSSRAIDNWHAILQESIHANRVNELLDTVLAQYRDNPHLSTAVENFRSIGWTNREIPENQTEFLVSSIFPDTQSYSQSYSDSGRLRNQEQLNQRVVQVVSHVASFFCIFLAIQLPMLLALNQGKEVSFINSKFAFNYTVAHDQIFNFTLIATLILYIPCRLISEKSARFLGRLWDKFQEVTPIHHAVFTLLGMVVLSLLLLGHWIYFLLPDWGYIESLLLALIVLLFGPLLAASNSNKK